ncbi:tRNA (adenine(58)-N(1))-methyltransferase, mitochondrial [Scleropages formosus]|uniref:tRNA (adenine(58)-N(1))-methyltransferase n=1 Tax=Scleropages formosus TaxID=113540 RepID=A0A8C9RBL9_SCLFO|nr:tRNA (adenine(58)-N(1))-methyltransferase, mitochondrial [Scleropages formosus]
MEMPLARLCGTLGRVCGACTRQRKCQVPCVRTWSLRTLSTGDKDHGGNGTSKETSESPFTGPQHPPGGHAPVRLGSKRRPLSPLERISRLLPQEALSQEVWDLRDATAKGLENGQEERRSLKSPPPIEQGYVEGGPSPTVSGEKPLGVGELVLAEYHGRFRQEFRKMFQLQEKGCLQSPWGFLTHRAIMGHISGTVMRFSGGAPVLVRRPSLEEYVLLMRRAPTIAYPKDASAILMMMDVTEGDSVLESGSGSGAMALFLSRAVGSKGTVLSVELRKDHQLRAVRNYQNWRKAWSLHRGEEWPDNVHFHNADLRAATTLLSGRSFNSVALDMLNPQLVLPTVFPHLHTGGVCTVYQANLTQVIDLLEGVRVSRLPIHCERIIEVQHKDWLVTLAIKKDGNSSARVAPHTQNDDNEEGKECQSQDEEMENLAEPAHAPFGTLPYIARPHHHQTSHTAFLVKLRKVVPQ